MLDIVEVRKSFGGNVALSGVSLHVPRGTCYGLLGPNGAGKTTLISILTGTLKADSGTVTLGGQPITPSSYEVKRMLGYVPQDLALYEDLSAWDNLVFFSSLYSLAGAEMERRIDYSLEISGLKDRRKGRVADFSGGMKRRLNLAAALLHQPQFLVLDEPTVGVDPQSRNLIFEALEALGQEGLTVLYTTHYMEEVERLCERVAIIDRGKVVAEDRLSELLRLSPVRQTVSVELEAPLLEFAGATLAGRTLSAEMEDLSVQLPDFLDRVRQAGGVISDLRVDHCSLEQVFLHLTGHSLRD